MIKELEEKLAVIDRELSELDGMEGGAAQLRRAQLRRDREELLEACRDCTPEDPDLSGPPRRTSGHGGVHPGAFHRLLCVPGGPFVRGRTPAFWGAWPASTAFR